MEIIPAIDMIDAKCVRLTFGDFNQKKIYNEDPLEVAKEFEDAGIKRLHLVDLDGAKSGKIVNYKTLEKITSKTNLRVDFGGGLNSNDDLKIAFECGAKMVTGGSIAVKNREVFTQWLSEYGAEKIILGADVKNNKIAIKGWQEESELTINELIESYQANGISKIICTDISKDGAMIGPSFDLYKGLQEQYPEQNFIASGGVTTLDDVIKLKEMNMFGAIIGKAIYEGTIKLSDLSKLV
ncbi:MAG: 1-(5-phosphoribosyl)-5-[(5-phosphoribosylamino)methylideneamino]imidazole-4-carboxamide isomerase [Salinivirgaceae bacterium]|jgi:phosphoribosylformimino-5-aminoimidazole carboxamide ribotide isomerase|nr:1-(5-phosphoribosyl)-5-[(5-phosphoribosylamino)methylideneamino]imidazole-4-carboxamide isomerase [Salinivirgaceae bacterium]